MSQDYTRFYQKQKRWKQNHGMTNEVRLRPNKKWCEEHGEDLTLPRFIGDKKVYVIDGKHYYPPRSDLAQRSEE